MNKLRNFVLVLVAAIAMPVLAQMMPAIPMDPAVRYGKLSNGLTYYIRHNALPENRANFYIAQKVGSVQEEESQRGLAHFLEHMCFNGSQNYPDDALVKYCESIGVKFGQNLNAYTSTDETVYNIDDVPVTDTNVDSCLLILHDWADGLTLDPKEIDKERGVIHEEWRMRSSGDTRIYERNLPTLYPGSRYGHRFPIGLMSVVDNFKPEELRAYYEKWYRPDLQGIIIVGDIDVDKVEQKVREIFEPIKMPENAAQYELYPVPDNAEPIYIVDKDKEMSMGIISIMFKSEVMPAELRGTAAYLVQQYMNQVICSVLNTRLDEQAKKADCPYAQASVEYGNYMVSKTCDALTLDVLPKTGQDKAAVEAAMTEIERARRYGFTQTELKRAADEYMSKLEATYNNREKQENSYFVPKYVRHFLEGNAIPSIETEYTLLKGLSTQLPAEIMNEGFKAYTESVDTNFVVLAMYPDKEGYAIPTVDDLKAAVKAAREANVEAYVDNVKSEPLITALPKSVKIKKEEAADFGYTCWTLKNGARVFYKVTDFNASEVQFSGHSFGGKSLTKPEDAKNAYLLAQVMGSTGLGNFSSTELDKKLAGKQVELSVGLGETTDNLYGKSTPKDLRTLFELLYLRFQEPANDVESYNNFITTLRTTLENADKQPMTAFRDSLAGTLTNHNPLRVAGLHAADLDQVSYEGIRNIYRQRFQSAGDFDFIFTGAIDVDSLRTFVEQYIAPLPGLKKRETYADRHIDYAKGTVDNHFVREMETPQAILAQVWTGDVKYDVKTAAVVNALGEVLTQRYLKSIREDAGVAYSVYAMGQASYGQKEQYLLQIVCPFKPAARDSVLLLMNEAIQDISKNGVTAEELDKVQKFELKQYADNQKKNDYWQDLIENKVLWNKDEQAGFEEAAKSVSSDDIRAFVNNYLLKQHNCTTVSMVPADFKE